MDRDRATESGYRPAALRRYIRALEQGDLNTVAAILQLAETDAVLEHLLLTANELDLEQQQSTVHTGVASLARVNQSSASESGTDMPAKRTARATSAVWPQRLTAPRWLSTVAAAVILVALIGGFFALFSAHGILGPFSKQATPVDTATPAMGHSIVVLDNPDGTIYALHANTGTVAWSKSGPPSIDTLVRSDDIVYVAAHPNNNGYRPSVTAYRVSDGAQLWQQLKLPLEGPAQLLLDGNTLLMDTSDYPGTIYALDALTGKVRWTQPSPSGLLARLMTAADGIVYIEQEDGFGAYDAATGKLLWNFNDPWRSGGLVIPGQAGLVYYDDTSLNDSVTPALFPQERPVVTAIDTTNGMVRQRLTLGQIGEPRLVTAAGVVYSTTRDNQVCAFRIADGKQLMCTSVLSGRESNLNLLATSSLLFYVHRTDTGVEVGAVSNATGKQVWTWRGSSTLYAAANAMSLREQPGILYMTTADGLYAFNEPTGAVLWHALPSIYVEDLL